MAPICDPSPGSRIGLSISQITRPASTSMVTQLIGKEVITLPGKVVIVEMIQSLICSGPRKVPYECSM